jgi:hypothetical protein
MPWVAAVAGGVMSLVSANQQSNAVEDASATQQATGMAGIAQQNKQFEAIQKLLAPFVQAGTGVDGKGGSLQAQMDLTGLGQPGAQQAAIDALMKSPGFTSQLQLGENRIMQNASATGGLRGGNVQGALAQFSPALLNSTINDQFARLGGITSLGQNAAAGVGNAGMSTGNNITQLLGGIGASQAGNALAQGRIGANTINGITQAFGAYYGNGNNFGGRYTSPNLFGVYSNPSGSGSGIDSQGMLGGGSTAGDYSDIRLKTDIEPLGLGANGLPLYSFRYVWGGARRTGHMAHEVIEKFPDAVSVDPSGFLMVDYSKV